MPPDLLAQVKANKPEILMLLSAPKKRADGQPPPLNRPPQTEQELRRLIDHTADPEVFARWLEWAMTYNDPAESQREQQT